MGAPNLTPVGITLNDLRRAVQKLASLRLNVDSTPTFGGLTLTGLIEALQAELESLTIKDSDGNIVIYMDEDEFYVNAVTAIPIEAGMSMGLLFAITYAAGE